METLDIKKMFLDAYESARFRENVCCRCKCEEIEPTLKQVIEALPENTGGENE